MIACSIIIPTFNRLADLQSCLSTLRAQELRGLCWEIIIVDNGSTDGTADWARGQAGGSNPRVRYVREPIPGLLAGRHRGAAEAAGEILTFVDDDIEAAPGWLQAIHMGLSTRNVAILGGPSIPKYEVSPPEWLEEFWGATQYGGRACPYLSLLDLGSVRKEISPVYIWGLNFSIRGQTLRELGGFHPDLVPTNLQHYQGDGETGLAIKAQRRGLISLYEPNARVLHRVPKERMTIEYFEKRAYYQGVCDSYTRARERGGLYGRLQRSIVRGMKRSVSHFVSRVLGKRHESTEPSRAPSDIRLKVRAAYNRGFADHQQAIMRDLFLRDWVLRPNYWDYAIPNS